MVEPTTVKVLPMANDDAPFCPPVAADAFAIKDCALLTIATGKKATTLKELQNHLSTIDPDSIYLHVWGSQLESQFEVREYNNHFASWARRGLHDDTLAERLAMVAPNEYADLEELRQEFLEVIAERLEEKEYLHWVLATEPFEFIRSTIVVFDTAKRVEQPEELIDLIPHLSTSSIFYHFIDARRRLPINQDDFRYWLTCWGDRYAELNHHLAAIDPYFNGLTTIRQQLANAFERYCPRKSP